MQHIILRTQGFLSHVQAGLYDCSILQECLTLNQVRRSFTENILFTKAQFGVVKHYSTFICLVRIYRFYGIIKAANAFDNVYHISCLLKHTYDFKATDIDDKFRCYLLGEVHSVTLWLLWYNMMPNKCAKCESPQTCVQLDTRGWLERCQESYTSNQVNFHHSIYIWTSKVGEDIYNSSILYYEMLMRVSCDPSPN